MIYARKRTNFHQMKERGVVHTGQCSQKEGANRKGYACRQIVNRKGLLMEDD